MRKMIVLVSIAGIFLASFGVVMADDLVLVHGLTNKHQWGEDFLDRCLQRYGSGHVYAVYTNESTRVWARWINGRMMIGCGEDDFSAGDDFVWKQAQLVREKTLLLQQYHGLSANIHIIAHSMGGLVSRRYVYDNPNTVSGLVTLGTPHQGSDLAYSGDWLDFFIGADDAVENLKPSWVQGYFNVQYPAPGPMITGGALYTIAGDGDGWDCWGWGGELFLGWNIFRTIYWTDSDGAVARGAEQIDGGIHIKTFWGYDHYELVKKPSVADKAIDHLLD